MTTWSAADTITSTWMNFVEKILAMGTFDAVADPRLTMTPNDNFDLIGKAVANDLRLNGPISVAANKYYAWLDARTLTSTFPSAGGTNYAAVLTFDHQVTTIPIGAGAYGVVGSVTGN